MAHSFILVSSNSEKKKKENSQEDCSVQQSYLVKSCLTKGETTTFAALITMPCGLK